MILIQCIQRLMSILRTTRQRHSRAFMILFLGFSVMGCGKKIVQRGATDIDPVLTVNDDSSSDDSSSSDDDSSSDDNLPLFIPPNLNSVGGIPGFSPTPGGYSYGQGTLFSFRPLANVLFQYNVPFNQGLTFQNEVGSFTPINDRLVHTSGQVALANLTLAREDLYMGGLIDLTNVNSGGHAGFFNHHHNPNAQDHCLYSCELYKSGSQTYARIITRLGTTTEPSSVAGELVSVLVPDSKGIVECVADDRGRNIIMYFNGRLIGARRMPFGRNPVNNFLFGFRAKALNKGIFGSAVVADFGLVPINKAIFFSDGFDTIAGSALSPAWEQNSGIIQAGALAQSTGGLRTVRLANTKARHVDLRLIYHLKDGSGIAGLVARDDIEVEVFKNAASTQVRLRVAGTEVLGPFTITGDAGVLRLVISGSNATIYSTTVANAGLDEGFSFLGSYTFDESGRKFGKIGMKLNTGAEANRFAWYGTSGPVD